MTHWVTVLAAELGGLFNPRDLRGEEEEDPWRLPSDHRMHTVACAHPQINEYM